MNQPVFSTSLQALLDAALPGQVVELPAGSYREKIVIRTPELTLRGAGAGRTILTWSDYALKQWCATGEEYNTFRTYTVAVCAPGVTIEDLTIENSAGSPQTKGQEVALTVYGDRFTMRRCALRSTQDTLFAGPLPPDLQERYREMLPPELRSSHPCRQLYEDCLIEGTVDFIFGCGEALFRQCEIRSLYEVRGHGYAAAPAHGPEQTEGFTFDRCRFTAAPGVPEGSVWLARPWRDYGLSRFLRCSYGPHIAPEGFNKWNDTNRDRTARFYEQPAVAGRVPWAREIP